MLKNNFLVFIILFSGCAVKTQTVSLNAIAPAQMQVLKCGDAQSVTLGIAPVVDKRPDYERTGKKPKGVYLGVWNQRIGNYMTSDADLGGNVLQAAAKQFISAIEKSNCFYEVKAFEEKIFSQPGPEELLVAFAKHKTRYILVSEIQHFYGTQYQQSHLAVIPALVVNAASVGNQVGLAQGFSEFLFVLYDTQTGSEIWRQKIEASSDSSIAGAYPQAAKDSLLKVSEKLANELYNYAQAAPKLEH